MFVCSTFNSVQSQFLLQLLCDLPKLKDHFLPKFKAEAALSNAFYHLLKLENEESPR